MWCNLCGLCGYDNLEQEGNEEEEGEEEEEGGYYRPAARWRRVVRRVRRRFMKRRNAKAQGFQYDALSYALNFDDRHSWREQGLLPTSRFSGPL